MRDAIKGVLIGAFVLALAGAIGARAGWITTDPPRVDGTGAWLLARVTGLLAYTALGLDVVVGLAVSTRSADRLLPRGHWIDLHGWLSPLAIGLLAVHAGVLLADGYVRFDVLDLVVPASLALGAGIVAGYLLVVVHASFGWRKRLGTAWWRRLHYLSFVAFALATAHALAAGSDRGRPWFVVVYGVLLAGVLGLLAIRIRRARAG